VSQRTIGGRVRRGVTAETALLLSEVLHTTPHFWMNLQVNHDLWTEQQKRRRAG